MTNLLQRIQKEASILDQCHFKVVFDIRFSLKVQAAFRIELDFQDMGASWNLVFKRIERQKAHWVSMVDKAAFKPVHAELMRCREETSAA